MVKYITLSNGFKLPQVGLGTYPLKGEQLMAALENATKSNYQLIDTAIGYGNHSDIGVAIRKGVISSSDLVSTKIDAYTLKSMALPGPLKRLAGRGEFSFLINDRVIRKAIKRCYDELNKVDIMLLHAPFKGCLKVYDAIAKEYADKRIKAFGVSNFDINELRLLYKERGAYPMINQTEISPYNSQKELIEFCKENGIIVEAYSPFGRGKLVSEFMQHPVLTEIASRYNKTVGQIILRWIVQQGLVVIARSSNKERLLDNISIFDFELSANDMGAIDNMNKNMVLGANQVNKKSLSNF